MVSQTWDDHDRSGRYLVRDFGRNYLATCEPNAVIFTNGDNDTFPLWNAQEVEGYRTDVRVCNLSYLQTDWYIDQMKRQAYTSEPLPINWKRYQYARGRREAAYVVNRFDQMWVEDVLNRIKSDDPRDKRIPRYNIEVDNVPTYRIKIPVDSIGIIANGLVDPKNSAWILPYIEVDLGDQPNVDGEPTMRPKNYIGKHEMMVLEMLKNNPGGERPFYFAITVGRDMYLRLDPYLRQDGIAYRIMPFEANSYQPVDADVMYDIVMNKYKYGNLEQPGLYIDENARRMSNTFRVIFGRLARQLAEQGDSIRAEEVADYSLKAIPSYNVPYDFYSVGDIAEVYDKIGAFEKADDLYQQLAQISMRNLDWYNRLNTQHYLSVLRSVKSDILFMQYIMYYFENNNTDLRDEYSYDFLKYIERFRRVTEGPRQTQQGGFNR